MKRFSSSARMYVFTLSLWFLLIVVAGTAACAQSGGPMRVGIVGLTHGHVAGFLPSISSRPEIKLVGIVGQNAALVQKYKAQFHLQDVPFYSTINELMEKQHPAALLVYTATSEHRRIIQDAAAYGVSVMVEKPLATTLEDALAIRRAQRDHHIQVLVNYETTWYASNHEALKAARQGRLGKLWKVVAHDGHRGPQEIGVQPEFLQWLSDPQKNGAGALFDFGCYGADLMTVLMDGRTPDSVTASLKTIKPGSYPRVDDDAIVVLTYAKTNAILEASWNWPFGRKDLEIYGASGSVMTIMRDQVSFQTSAAEEAVSSAPSLQAPEDDPIHYLVAAVNGQVDTAHSLSGIETNVVVVQILDAARRSAQTGRTVRLTPLGGS